MYLKSLEINGFKSFSNKVNIDFNKGITSIVGPNGSGKSNILDAVLWVLGEQSYKSIRAKDSTDVIFSGGKNKKARSSARVSLTIDNSDRYIDFDSDDIVITRHISRDGESVYSLNENKVRLKDIQALLMDTGIGKQAYSVIGQGKVEKIISSSSQEIRNIIDEAAGIKKAKVEKENANKRLLNVETEVEKIEYVELELKNRVAELEQESKKARVYVAYTKEINALKYMVYKHYIDKLSNINDDITNKIKKIDEDIFNIDNNILQAEKNIEINRKTKSEIEQKLQLIFDNDTKNNKELEILKQRQVEYIDKKANFNADLKFKIIEKEKLKKKLEEHLFEIEKIKEIIKEFEKEKLDKDKILFQKQEKMTNIEKNILDLENKIKNCEEKNKELEINKLKLEVYNEDLLKRINQAKNRKKQVELEKKEASIKLESIIKSNKIDKNLEDVLTNLEKMISQKNKLQLKKEELNTKKKVIENNLENYTLMNNAIQYIHKNSNNDNNVFGPLVSMIEVDSKYQLAISVIASYSLNDIVVKDFETAKKYIQLLKNSKIGTASFLPVENIYIRKLNTDKNNYARNVVKNVSNNKYIDKVIDYIFANTVIVNNMDEGIELAKTYKDKIVTLDGDVISATGRITGGYIKKKVDETLQKKEEIKNIYNELDLISKELDKIIKDIQVLENEKENLLKYENNKKEKEKEISVYDYEINENIAFIDEKEKQVNQNFESIKNIKLNISENNKKEVEYKSSLLNIEDNYELKNEISDLNIELAVIKEKKNNIQSSYLAKKEDYDIQKKEYDDIADFILKKDDIFSEIESNLKDINDKIFNIEQGNNISKNEINTLNKNNLQLLDEYTKILDDKSKLEIDKNSLENNLVNLKNDFERNSIEKDKYKEKFEELYENIEEIKKYYDFKDNIEESNLKLYERKISLNEKSRAELGDININSISEYEKESNRYESLLNEKFDLIKSKDSIVNLINDINVEIVEKFNDAISNISQNFEYMCKELLNGAKSSIQIQDLDNLLETGLELRVKYKNKPEQSLSLLSGGEKSMLAVSFIMAIFMYKPSPFTFFDEVEAALDEANTRKLIKLLKDFNNSQFILITHNKETMKGSDRLYGVTMNKEIGESVLVSVDI